MRPLFFALLLAACSETPPTARQTPVVPLEPQAATPLPEQNLRGTFSQTDEGPAFYDCTAGKTYRVLVHPSSLDSMYREACQPSPVPGEPVVAVVQGVITPFPASSADSIVQGTLIINRIDSLSARTIRSTCPPYVFWCIGTEPFWGLVIDARNGISLKHIGSETGKWFPFPKTAPQRDGNTWVYESVHAGSGERLRAVIRREMCSDGMSDRQYAYSAEVRIGREILRGCAIQGQDQ